MNYNKINCLLFILILVVLILYFLNENNTPIKHNIETFETNIKPIQNLNNTNDNSDLLESFIDQKKAIINHKKIINNIKKELKKNKKRLQTKKFKPKLDENKELFKNKILKEINNQKKQYEKQIMESEQNKNVKTKEKFQNKNNSNDNDNDNEVEEEDSNINMMNIDDQFNKLEKLEQYCMKIEKDQDQKDKVEQIKLNEMTLKELEIQDKRINELKDIVNYLKAEEKAHEQINKKCKSDTQKMINNDYSLVNDLAQRGLIKDESIKLNLKGNKDLKLQLQNLLQEIKNKRSENTNQNNQISNQSENEQKPTTTSPEPESGQGESGSGESGSGESGSGESGQGESGSGESGQGESNSGSGSNSGSTNQRTTPSFSNNEFDSQYYTNLAKKCGKKSDDYIHIDQLGESGGSAEGKCFGCDKNKLKPYAYKINQDFK